MSYSDLTFKDKNPFKRWLQHERLRTAVAASRSKLGTSESRHACDYGAGNGELCKELAKAYPTLNLLCYEPVVSLMQEAQENLKQFNKVRYFDEILGIPSNSVDALFCLEVFEHLPAKELDDAFVQIERCLTRDGVAIIGVPNEIGVPALYKGCFRMIRRYGEFDAAPLNILRSLFGFPPKHRPAAEIAPGLLFHFHHTGFDHRELKKALLTRFLVSKVIPSPCALLGNWINPEIYFVVKKLA